MSEIKLLPCPFCGGEAKISINKSSQGQVGIVECTKCSCRKTMLKYPFYEGNVEKDVADSWNRRKPIDRIVEQLEERTEFLSGCTKYGNKNAEQQEKSYSTMMMYEVADLFEDLIDIVKAGGKSD